MVLLIDAIGDQSLLSPVEVRISKSQVVAQYPLVYLQNFNYYAREGVVTSSVFACDDGHYDESPSCGWAYSSTGSKIPHS